MNSIYRKCRGHEEECPLFICKRRIDEHPFVIEHLLTELHQSDVLYDALEKNKTLLPELFGDLYQKTTRSSLKSVRPFFHYRYVPLVHISV